jgi:hypothetical protein
VDQLTIDLVVLGLAGAVPAAIWWNESAAAGFLCACLWLALNTVLLARLLEAVTLGGERGAGIGLLLACAKIPVSYAILFWLYQVDFLDKWGLTAGVLSLPVVLLARGIAVRQRHISEEGRA